MKIKYCKFCEPFPELIDEDSMEATGYIIKGKRKIYLCNLCLEGQKQYFPVVYFEKSKNKLPEECMHDPSNYIKKNLVTLDDGAGGYDILKCEICGFEIKRKGIADKTEIFKKNT